PRAPALHRAASQRCHWLPQRRLPLRRDLFTQEDKRAHDFSLPSLARRRRSVPRAMTFSISASDLPLTCWARAVIRPPIELACLANLLRLARPRACLSALVKIINHLPGSPPKMAGYVIRVKRENYVT